MILNFVVDKSGFRITTPVQPEVETSVNYIKCHFDIDPILWNDVDVVVAVFKSARYNIMSEVILDSNNNCFIDPNVYKRGGTIQVKLFGDKYNDEEVLSTSHVTGVVEFIIEESELAPTEPPSKYSVFIAELERVGRLVDDALDDLDYRLEHHEFDGPAGVGITNVSYLETGQVIITLSDATSFISEYSLRGEKGEKGDPGEPGPPAVTSYNDLLDKPEIEGVVLEGNKMFPQLNLDVLSNMDIQSIFNDLI